MNKKHKQDKSFLLGNLLMIALFIFVFLLFSYWEYNRYLNREKQNNLRQTEIKAELAKQWVSERYEQFKTLTGVFSMAQTSSERVKLIKSFETSNPDIFKKLYYVDANYNSVSSSGRSHVSQEEFRKIFDQVGGQEHLLLTRAEFYSETEEPVFSLISGIRSKENVLRGILVGVVSLNQLLPRINSLSSTTEKSSRPSSTWILDSKKQILLHNNNEMILDFKMIQEEDAKYQNVNSINNLIDNNASGNIHYMVKNNENLFLSFVKTKISDGWVIMVGRVETDFWSFLMINWPKKLALLLFSILATISLQYYLHYQTLRPFKAIHSALVAFNAGTRYFNPEIEDDGITGQIGVAGQIVEEMDIIINRVVDQSYNVEKLIRERTKVLSDLNSTIANRNKELQEINTALSENNSHLKHKATTDMLTQLLNRQEFLALTDNLMNEIKNNNEELFSVLFLDLDNFKQYNDNFSHDVGDFVLKSISNLIQSNVRSMDVCARYGGDEFVILIHHPEKAVAISTAKRILNKIKEVNGFADEIEKLTGEKVSLDANRQLSCSIGVVHYSNEMELDSAEELMTLADDMMYQAKKAGKDRIEIYQEMD